MRKPIVTTLIFLFLLRGGISAQNGYDSLYQNLKQMIEGKNPVQFKKIVFALENLYLDNQLDGQQFDNQIEMLVELVKSRKKATANGNLQTVVIAKDAETLATYASLYKVMTDTTFIQFGNLRAAHLPFRYNFDDPFAEKDWVNRFVSRLLETHKGNCQSMPYLYKIICEKLGLNCHLALAPNHIYIKHPSETIGWYNTELTNASFPADAWLIASGYISLEALQNGLYMEALEDKQTLALCLYDLAKCYARKFPDNDGRFVIKCCDLALVHHPNNIMALILKAETRKKQFNAWAKSHKIPPSVAQQQREGKAIWEDMTRLYNHIHQLGYRAMPIEMYRNWRASVQKERDKHINR